MGVTTRDVEYDADGTTMRGRLALPDGSGVRPAVLIAHEGPGLDDFQRERVGTYAELGYVAFALDYHGGGKVFTDYPEMLERLGGLSADPDRMRRLGQAGLDVLLSQERADPARVAVTGYCFGGAMALELARAGADLKAVVGFHPGLGTTRPEDARNIVGKVLMCVGADDPLIPAEQLAAFKEEMRAGGVDWRVNLYGGAAHSFTNPLAVGQLPGVQFDEVADRRSWRAMLELFEEVFGSSTYS
jgi:dienelactone hydrolase